MDLFPDGGFVLLQSVGKRDQYVHADGDWERVSLRPLALGTVASLEAVWRVEHLAVAAADNQEQVICLQLQNAAYGRYLSHWPQEAQHGHRGQRVDQDDRVLLVDDMLCWRVQRVDPNEDNVRLRSFGSNFDLRANGRYRTWNTRVTVDENRRSSPTTMMQWTVHVVPASPVPQPLLPAAPPQPQQGRLRGLLSWRPGVHQLPARTIRHVLASDEGNYDQNHNNWPAFEFHDTSVITLKNELRVRQGWNEDMAAYTLCTRSGLHGRLMPQVTDLPRSKYPMNIVVLRTGTPGAAALAYPQIDAQAQ